MSEIAYTQYSEMALLVYAARDYDQLTQVCHRGMRKITGMPPSLAQRATGKRGS